MLKARREGPTRRPNAREWILDDILVGVGVVRVLRELYGETAAGHRPVRAWDLAMWCGVTPQHTTRVLHRLHRHGFVREWTPPRRDEAATWVKVPSHPLYLPLGRLFGAEREMLRSVMARGTSTVERRNLP